MTMSSALSDLPDFLQDDFHAMENRAMSGSSVSSRFSMISAGIVLVLITLVSATGIYFWKFKNSVIHDTDASLHVASVKPSPVQGIAPLPAVVNAPRIEKTVLNKPAPAVKSLAPAVVLQQPVQTMKMAMSMQSFVAFSDGKAILSNQAREHVHLVATEAKTAKVVHLRGFSGHYTKKNSSLERLAFSRALAVKSVLVDDGVTPRNIKIYRNNNVRSYLTKEETIKNPARVEISIIKK
jgi:outer membrane protein OmpA-like peptidoglycan-associated protein